MKKYLTYWFDEGEARPRGLEIAGLRVRVATVTLRQAGEQEAKRRLVRPALEALFPGLKELEEERRAVATRNQEKAKAKGSTKPVVKGKKGKGDELEEIPDYPPEFALYYDAFHRWPRIAVATVSVETCAAGKETDEVSEETAVWRESSLAELGLHEPEGTLDLPQALVAAWDALVVAANENVFTVDESEAAKKKGTISAS